MRIILAVVIKFMKVWKRKAQKLLYTSYHCFKLTYLTENSLENRFSVIIKVYVVHELPGSKDVKLRVVIVSRHEVKLHVSIHDGQDGLKLKLQILHGHDRPFFSLVLAQLFLVTFALELFQLLLDSNLQV